MACCLVGIRTTLKYAGHPENVPVRPLLLLSTFVGVLFGFTSSLWFFIASQFQTGVDSVDLKATFKNSIKGVALWTAITVIIELAFFFAWFKEL